VAEIARPYQQVATRQRSLRRAATRFLFYLAVAGIVIWSVGPFIWQLNASLQPDRYLAASPPHFLPVPATIEHYYNVFFVKQFQFYIINSIIVAGITTLLCLTFGSLAAYGLARRSRSWRRSTCSCPHSVF
jgi:multiple sugar transport system permease protein/trehalose/maltose transport system permease protein